MKRLQIVYQEQDFLVVEKESGVLSVPGRGADKQDSLSTRIREKYKHCIDQPAVHRLDMDTSGLMVYALTAKAHRSFSIQFQNRQVQKKYIAVVDGYVGEENGRIEMPFRLDIYDRPHQVYDPVHGKIGITLWCRIAFENGRTRLEFTPLTGRTHQLRVHAAHSLGLGCPILGDRLYGEAQSAKRLLLHASYLSVAHPKTGQEMIYTSPAPF